MCSLGRCLRRNPPPTQANFSFLVLDQPRRAMDQLMNAGSFKPKYPKGLLASIRDIADAFLAVSPPAAEIPRVFS
jgi:hypothetical protein